MNHLIIFAHPNNQNSFGRAITDIVLESSRKLGVNTVLRDLYSMDFEPIMSYEELQASYQGIVPAEVEYEHQLIRNADLITLIYPLWWMGFPAILKGYLDRVLSHGFAYKTENGESVGLLQGKQMHQIITMGNNFTQYQAAGFVQSLDHCLVNGLFNYCGIGEVSYQLFGDIHSINEAARKDILAEIEEKTRQNLTALWEINNEQ
ncbi:NAD(P)H-dependent oxidoreductase [Rodentibacter caecimuris]|uniref:NAD(P)H oxidoreductase n=1 Tax=Rodentibacter caecimuris TaxID=1796644 RepID=A0ABX3L009_9PAST|nr:NAD(P)H oxidoreductase [Rodentibacter heylii]